MLLLGICIQIEWSQNKLLQSLAKYSAMRFRITKHMLSDRTVIIIDSFMKDYKGTLIRCMFLKSTHWHAYRIPGFLSIGMLIRVGTLIRVQEVV